MYINITASQINHNTTIYSTTCLGKQQRKHQSSKLLSLCEGNPPMTGGFPSQSASNAESVSLSLCHHNISLTWTELWLVAALHWICWLRWVPQPGPAPPRPQSSSLQGPHPLTVTCALCLLETSAGKNTMCRDYFGERAQPVREREREREREIKFIGLFENRGHRGPYPANERWHYIVKVISHWLGVYTKLFRSMICKLLFWSHNQTKRFNIIHLTAYWFG